MGLFKNDVGRPSNETIKKRNIFKGICVVLVLIIITLVCYIFKDDIRIFNSSNNKVNNNNKNDTISTTKQVTTIESKSYTPKEAFDKFAKDNNLIVRQNGEGYDMDALKSVNCNTAISALEKNDKYFIEILEFDDVESAYKEYERQTETPRLERKLLTDKSGNNYNVIETNYTYSDPEDNSEVHGYTYMVRIDNYYICLGSNTEKDQYDSMVILKEQLNSLLNIK